MGKNSTLTLDPESTRSFYLGQELGLSGTHGKYYATVVNIDHRSGTIDIGERTLWNLVRIVFGRTRLWCRSMVRNVLQ